MATLYSLLFIFFSTHSSLLVVFFFFTLTHTNYFFQMQQHFAFSSSAIFLKAATLCSPLLDYLLEGGNTLHSPSSCISPKRKSFFSFLVSRSIFPLPIGRTLGPKPKAIKFFLTLSIYKTLLLFPLGLGIHYLFNKESIFSWTRKTLPL